MTLGHAKRDNSTQRHLSSEQNVLEIPIMVAYAVIRCVAESLRVRIAAHITIRGLIGL